ncbi:hypothetical protein BKA64DRAFT_676795 [Cadophora sp. MPI-SDFR-AT-0126]|nr:hypothetical protein BKA64DRAFT_676795 [Leotiomycetes sp. MPI-SDFR-AT-0126]
MTCRLEPGVYYIDGNGSPLFITDVDYHSFSLTILTTIISSLTKAYRSALAAKPYVQACHKLQYADRSSKDMGDLLSLRYGASEPDPLRNFLVELSIRAFLGVSYRIPQKSLEEMDRNDHSRFAQFCEVTANKVPQTQRTRYVKRALRDIDKQYFSQLQQELNDTSDTEGQTTTVLRSTGTKLITQAKNTSQNPREPRPSRSPLIHSAVPDPSKTPVDQPSSKRARIETLSPSPSNSRDGGAQQNDQLDTRSDGLRMQVDSEGMSTHGQELESVSRSSNSPEHSDDSQPSTIFHPAALTSENMQSQHCASRESRQFNVPNSTTPAETTDQENQMMAQDRTLMISDIIESNPSPGQTMPQLLSSMALTCTSEHDGAEGEKASSTILIQANQC